MAEADVEVKFGADTHGIESGSKTAAHAVQEFGERLNEVAEKALKFTEIALIGGAVKEVAEKISEFVEGMAELGDVTEDTAAILGVATERIGELEYIAEASGGRLESVAMGMEMLATNSQKAAAGGRDQMDAFNRLGVSLKNADGSTKDLNELLLETADSFSKHADGAEKVALARQLMGRAGAQMIPTLNEGRKGFEDLEAAAKRTGVTLSEQTVKGMMEVHGSLVEVGNAFQGLGVSIFNSFQPAIEAVLQTIAGLIERFSAWISNSYNAGGAMRTLALMTDVVVSAVMALVAAFELLWDIASGIVDTLSQSLGSLGKEMAYILQGDFAKAGEEAKAAADGILNTWKRAGQDMGSVLTGFSDNIKKMWAATLNPPADITVHKGEDKPAFGSPTDFNAQKAKIDQLKQTMKEVQSTFENVFGSIIGGFDKAISGLITGTMSWKEAMFDALDGIWSSFIKLIEDWVAKWLAGEATMLVAHQTANAEKVASDQIAGSTSAFDMIGNAIKSIFVSSKQTAAGVTANLSPALGPLAIPAGLAAGATVAGMASFDVGAWNLSRDQVAQVHEGEMIVPAKNGMADQVRSMLSGGGSGGGDTHYNFMGPVMDKAGLTKVLADFMTKNPSARPGY